MIKAKLRYLRISPRKVRLVADLIRGLSVKDAQNQLRFMNKRSALPMLKLLDSAVANAKNNFKLNEENLFIKEIRADEGPTLKRWMPRAFGRATPINKRSSHILIILDEKREAGYKKMEIKDTESILQPRPFGLELNAKRSGQAKAQKTQKTAIKEDVKIIKSLDEVKELGKKEDVRVKDEKKSNIIEHKVEPFDVRKEGSGRSKQHLDSVKRKGKGGVLKRVFRRKSV